MYGSQRSFYPRVIRRIAAVIPSDHHDTPLPTPAITGRRMAGTMG
jgi:hypothetical protein